MAHFYSEKNPMLVMILVTGITLLNMQTGVYAVGIAASVFTAISTLPQLVKLYKAKKAEDVSKKAFVILIVGLVCWIVYGFLRDDWILLISSLFSLCINAAIVVLTVRYKNNS